MRAAEKRTEHLDFLHPPETPRPERAGRGAGFRTILGRTLVQLVEHVISWDQCGRDRRLLASLDDRMLRDIGIRRDMVERDSTSSIWRLRQLVGLDCAVGRRCVGCQARDGCAYLLRSCLHWIGVRSAFGAALSDTCLNRTHLSRGAAVPDTCSTVLME
jgi:uncharacterized protein YjiS (DUF1127 family)